MLDPRSFERYCTGLKIGGRLRVDHDCGPGRTLTVSRKDSGYMAHCFRCNDTGFIDDVRTLAERIADLAAVRVQDEVARCSVSLPGPPVLDPQEWPSKARVWLYRVGLSNDAIIALGFYYHAATGRVVLPVHDELGNVIYWQARSFEAGVPKYLNPLVDKSSITPKYGRGDVLVLTEDILSAVKVGMVTEAWSIMGTSLSSSLALAIVEHGKPVVIMLDPDDAGRKGTAKIEKRLRLLGLPVTHFFGRVDPKLMNKQELHSCIQTLRSSLSA